jgi:hypothetical protein
MERQDIDLVTPGAEELQDGSHRQWSTAGLEERVRREHENPHPTASIAGPGTPACRMTALIAAS